MTTTEKKRYLFAKLPPVLQEFGFFPFKGKLWCYRPEQQMVYYIDCTFTQWGTLNEVEIGVGSFCSPIQKGRLKNTLNVSTVIDLCRYIRFTQNFTVFAMYGENADSIFVAQVDALLPYLEAEFKRVFDLKHRSDLLQQTRLLLDMQLVMRVVIPFDFALHQYNVGCPGAAHEFLNCRIATCQQIIGRLRKRKEELEEDHFAFLCDLYGGMIEESNEYAKRIDSNDPQLSKMIDERIKESAALCEEFFRHRRKKSTP
ncbi:MAG: hypothetical protein IKK75_12120 [Clostridia bacterium]|nr:hypothetical protein [Clostridia bacterium]